MTFKKGHKINVGRKAWNKGIPRTEEEKIKQGISMKGKLSGKKHHQYKHGFCRTPIYKKWESMKRRCLNKNEKSYHNYGGRGITVCDEWLKFENFEKDMNDSFIEGMSLERKDNNKGYNKNNCKWIPLAQQSKNRRSVILYTYNGKTMNIAEWAKKIGIKAPTLSGRLKRYGWTIEQALTTKTNYANRFKNSNS